MRIYFYFIVTVFLVITLVKSSSGITCTVRSSSCAASESCLFSFYQENDSHAGVCGEYTNRVCCDTITSSSIKSSCAVDEVGILSFFNTTDSHAERYGLGNYNNHLCVSPPVSCGFFSRDCYANETTLISMNSSTNSHVAISAYYSNKICCKEAQMTINFNVSKVWWNDSINASGYTFPSTWVQINRSSNLVCNITSDSNGFYSCVFNAPQEVGVYTYNAYSLNVNGNISTQNSALLNVAPNYGGTATRGDISVYEIPMLIQEPTGKIRTVNVKIKVWRVI